jgi:hypothetical protein
LPQGDVEAMKCFVTALEPSEDGLLHTLREAKLSKFFPELSLAGCYTKTDLVTRVTEDPECETAAYLFKYLDWNRI